MEYCECVKRSALEFFWMKWVEKRFSSSIAKYVIVFRGIVTRKLREIFTAMVKKWKLFIENLRKINFFKRLRNIKRLKRFIWAGTRERNNTSAWQHLMKKLLVNIQIRRRETNSKQHWNEERERLKPIGIVMEIIITCCSKTHV